MNESKISVRYAKALFSLSRETNTLDVLKKDMEMLLQCISEVPDLQYIIQSPVIKSGEKIRLFSEVFKNSFSELSFSFISMVLENKREEFLAGMARYFLELLRTEQGVQSAMLTTAISVDDDTRRSVLQLISKKFNTKAELKEVVDTSIIGGFILQVGDQQLDSSISGKLKRIKKELIY